MPAKASQSRSNGGAIRIIGGEFRGRSLPVVDSPGLRPTSDRVRETLFNWLQFHLNGARVLDLFAGTGVLGLEALSRGAASAVFCETEAQLARQLRERVALLKVQDRATVVQDDARLQLQAMQREGQSFDVLFVDPPFAEHLHASVLPLLDAVATKSAFLYLESPVNERLVVPSEWELHREGATREVRYALYRKAT